VSAKFLIIGLVITLFVNGANAKTCLENLNAILEYKTMKELRTKLIAETVSGKRKANELLLKAISANELDQFLLGGEKYGFLPRDTYSTSHIDTGEIFKVIYHYVADHPKLIDRQLEEALIKNCKDPREIETAVDFFETGFFRKIDYHWKNSFDFDYEKLALTLKALIKNNEAFLKEHNAKYTTRSLWEVFAMEAKTMEMYDKELSRYGISVPNFFPEERPINIKLDSAQLIPNPDGMEPEYRHVWQKE